MNQLPENWLTTVLSEISIIEMGQSPASSTYNNQQKGLPFFQGKAEFGKLYPIVRKWCTQPKKVAEAGDILLSVRAPVGPTNLASEKCCIGRGLAAIRAEAPINQKYLLHHFRNIEPWLTQQGTGSTFAAISGGFIRELQAPLAPLNEQKRIADKLDTLLARVDSCQSHLERVPQILKRFRQSVLAAATSGRLTEEWREERAVNAEWVNCFLGDVLIDIRYGTAKKSVYELKNGTPVLRIPNVVNGKVDASDLKFSHFEKKEIETLSLKADDLLLIRSNGSVELVGKVAIVDKEFEGFLYAGYLIRLRFDKGKVNPRYISHYLSSPAIRSHIELTARSTSGVNNINSEEVKAISLDLPSLEEQAEIVRRVETLFAFADRLETRYGTGHALVEQLTPSLLAKAFRGALVPQDSNDEPASVLLERIREAREADQASSTGKKPFRKKDRTTKEVGMLKLSEIQENHLSAILKERGRMTSEALWSASQLEIDDFYDQLKVEEAKGHLREIRSSDPDSPRMLEAT